MADTQEVSYYDNLVANDLISRLRPLLVSGGYKLRDEDGKIVVVTPALAFDTPWHHVAHDAFLDCQRWHSILFEFFSKNVPDGEAFVPSACQQCWKVVVRPQSLLALFSLLELEMKLDRPSKCGIEPRPYVFGHYGGYFYNHSLEEGLECYKLVRSEVDNDPNLGPETPVLLKRACTEYEQKINHSKEWVVTPHQIAIENLINRWFVSDGILREQPKHALDNVHARWIEYAYSNGDPTYKMFTNGKPPKRLNVVEYDTYHDLVDADEETLQAALEKYQRRYFYDYDL